jgi:hypothetical protein
MAAPDKWQEVNVYAYQFARVRMGGDTVVRVYFFVTDLKLDSICMYQFLENVLPSVRSKIDSAALGDPGYHVTFETVGTDRAPAIKYPIVGGFRLDELTGRGGKVTTGSVAIAKVYEHGGFLVRIDMDLDEKRDGQSLRGFMLPFGGNPPADLVGKVIRGTVGKLGPAAPYTVKEYTKLEQYLKSVVPDGQ